jgi:hypothetical protein
MKKIQLLLVSIAFGACSFGQTTERIYVKAGNDQWERFLEAIYLYPAFKEGMVELKSGQRYLRPMNYNKVAATLEFISEKNDTMAFADESAVGHVNIGGDIFLFTPVCLRALSSKKAKLYVYERIKIGDKQKIGAMGIPNSTTAIESVEKIDTYQRSYNINLNETVILARTTSYLIKTNNSEIVPANKKNVLNLFPNNEPQVKEFLKSKNISFNKESDLLELVKFLDEL